MYVHFACDAPAKCTYIDGPGLCCETVLTCQGGAWQAGPTLCPD
jgi:hypothetical protein